MKFLERFRYAPVWIKEQKTETLIFDKDSVEDWNRAWGFWNQARSYKGSRENFLEAFNYLTKKTSPVKAPLHRGFLSCLPEESILTPLQYQKFLKDKVILFVERFFHPESRFHTGSSRHVLLGDVQVKGVGRNGLVSRIDYLHSWGGLLPLEGIYSYLISNFLSLQLPLGAARTFKVDKLSKDTWQLARLYQMPRLGQLDYHLTDKEKEILKLQLEAKLKTKNPKEMYLQFIHQQYVSAWANIYNYSMIPENILLDGSVLDCESVYNAPHLGQLSLCLDLAFKGKSAKHIKKSELQSWEGLLRYFHGKEGGVLCNTSLHGPISILKHQKKLLEYLYEVSFEENEEIYLDRFLELVDAPSHKLRSVLKSLSEAASEIQCHDDARFNLKSYQDLKHFLDPINPFEIFFFSQDENQTYLRLRFNLKRKDDSHPLVRLYNTKPRMQLWKEAAIFLKMLKKGNPFEAASMLNLSVQDALFVTPESKKERSELKKILKKTDVLSWVTLESDRLIEGSGTLSSLPRTAFILTSVREVQGLCRPLAPFLVE